MTCGGTAEEIIPTCVEESWYRERWFVCSCHYVTLAGEDGSLSDEHQETNDDCYSDAYGYGY